MSYATSGLGQVLTVGTAARRDVLLANASLTASKILLQAAKRPIATRPAFVASKLNAMQSGLYAKVDATRRKLIASGKSPDQAMFDAMRLAIANVRLDSGLEELRASAGAEALGSMSAGDRQTACTITGVATTVGGVASVVPVYGTIIGGIIGIGSQIAGGALDCTREQREAAAAAAQAQANLIAAQQAAAQQAAMQQAAMQSGRMRLYVIGGVGLVAALGIGYILLS